MGPGGPSPNFPKTGKSKENRVFKMGLGETGFPKGLLGTIQSIPVTGNPLISIFETIPPQNHVFLGAIFPPKTSPGQPEPNFQIPGPNLGMGPKMLVPCPWSLVPGPWSLVPGNMVLWRNGFEIGD